MPSILNMQQRAWDSMQATYQQALAVLEKEGYDPAQLTLNSVAVQPIPYTHNVQRLPMKFLLVRLLCSPVILIWPGHRRSIRR